jgi:hypothetical protein
MTQVKAAHMKGVRIEGRETFASIPGLIMWCETDFGVALSGSDILNIADRSGFNNAIVGASAPRRAQLVSIGGGFNAMQNSGNGKWSIIYDPPLKGWNSIIKQQPFGIFSLFSRNNAGTGTIVKHLGNEANKMWLLVDANGSVKHVFRNSANSETEWGSANGVVSLNNTIHAIDLVSYGSGNNPRLELFANTSSVATRATSNLTGSETAGVDLRIIETNNASAISQLVMVLVYDWTGYSVAQINDFRQRINNLREEKYGSIF